MWYIVLVIAAMSGALVARGPLERGYPTRAACEAAAPKALVNIKAAATLHGRVTSFVCVSAADLAKLQLFE
jgi:hypothetical protein